MTLRMALFPLTLLCLSLDSHGGENKSHDWDWALISSGFMASQIAITTGSHSVGYIDFDCDLSDYKKTITSEVELASIHRVVTADFPKGVLVVSCYVGAHSEKISIINPEENLSEPVFSKVGSYFVDWDLKQSRLWVDYDRPCDVQKDMACDVPFTRVSIPWPSR